MKKFLFSLAAMFIMMFTMCLTSCNSNKSKDTADEEEILSQMEVGNGFISYAVNYTPEGKKEPEVRYGLKDRNGKVLIEPREYLSINYDYDLGCFVCKTNSKQYTVADSTGYIMRYGSYDRVTKDKDGAYYRFYNADGIAVYCTKTKKTWGMYDEVITTDNFIFEKSGSKWGFTSIDGKYYFEKIYDKIYVVNYKSEKEFDVVIYKDGKWELCDQSEAYYDASQTDIKTLIKHPTGPAGVLDVKF